MEQMGKRKGLLLCGILVGVVSLMLLAWYRRKPQERPHPATDYEQVVASGVIYRRFLLGDPIAGSSDAFVLDVDLSTPGLRMQIVGENTAPSDHRVYADVHLVRDWCARYRAIGGINGGFFGLTHGDRKEVIGLLATDGIVRSPSAVVLAHHNSGQHVLRSVLGFSSDGTPHIGWATGERDHPAKLHEYPGPTDQGASSEWEIGSAVACGPRLIEAGQKRITDHEEWLVSPPALYRTFVGYSIDNGKPRHIVLGVGNTMTFDDVAQFLQRYFHKEYQTDCADAMCLDGGSSSQMVYRTDQGYMDVRPTPVTVPTALLILVTKP